MNWIRADWHMSPEAARAAALVKSVAYIKRKAPDSDEKKLAELFPLYVAKLRTKADDNGKAARSGTQR